MAGWGILQLKDTPEPIPADVLERDLKMRWPDVVCVFPAVRHGIIERDNPLSTYVFVKAPLSTRIERSPYVYRLLREPGTQRLQKVTDDELQALLPPPSLPSVGDVIRIASGDHAGLFATVVKTNCTSIQAQIELWSRKYVVQLTADDLT